ncbi:hypothetical protein [Zavarzinia sp.]|uniref:hypothetical protein n=1 Tax=Zavarzinia sp. TaxID=2027920 RepID=UPI003562201E
MSLTRWQLGLLHSAPASLGVLEDERKLVQANLGGAWSAKDMDYAGLCRVMAFWESKGYVDPANGPGWWAAQEDGSRTVALRGKVLKLAALAGWIVQGRPEGRNVDFARIDAFCAAQFAGRSGCSRLKDAGPGDLLELVEAFKEIAKRAGAKVWDDSPDVRAVRRSGKTVATAMLCACALWATLPAGAAERQVPLHLARETDGGPASLHRAASVVPEGLRPAGVSTDARPATRAPDLSPGRSTVLAKGAADGAARAARQNGLRRLLAAIRQVESGGDDRAVGDGGKARGPYQI